MRAEFCIFESNAPGLKANFYEPYVDKPTPPPSLSLSLTLSLSLSLLKIHLQRRHDSRHDEVRYLHRKQPHFGWTNNPYLKDVIRDPTRKLFDPAAVLVGVQSCTRKWQGCTQRGFEGVHQIQLGVWGRCEPPSGVRGGAPEDFEINAFQRLRTPVSLSFLSQCCYTKIHAIFFIHSHPHHFQLNAGRAQSHALIPKKPMSKNCPVLSLVLHLHHDEACWCSEFWKQFRTVIQGQKKLFTVISTCTLCSLPVRR